MQEQTSSAPDKKQEKVRQKKKKIIEALKRCLERGVYSNITVMDVAQEAGYSKGGVLHYFSTKEEMYMELIEELFQEFEMAHTAVLEAELDGKKTASMSALVGAENFIFDKTNIRIIINLLLYGYADEKIMSVIRKYIKRHRRFYENVIGRRHEEKQMRRRSDVSPAHLARIAQSIVIFIGLLEDIDPSEMNNLEVVKFISTLLGS